MTNKILFTALAILAIGVFSLVCSSQVKPPSLPAINITPPDPSLPLAIKSLSGTWVGHWSNPKSPAGWDCTLYVLKIDQNFAEVIHSWGEFVTSNQTCHCAPDWRRIRQATVTYTDGRAKLEFWTPPYQRTRSHELSGTGEKLEGKYYSFSFTLDQSQPNEMQGRFISGKKSTMFIDMKKIN